jgi:antirestriction protein ArdC
MTNREKINEAYSNAIGHRSTANFGPIIDGFMEKGIPADDIRPRENVFTFWAWKALGRRVRKGEHGVKVITWVPMEGKKAADTSDNAEQPQPDRKPRKGASRPWTTTVFHVSQTEPDPYYKPDEQAAA